MRFYICALIVMLVIACSYGLFIAWMGSVSLDKYGECVTKVRYLDTVYDLPDDGEALIQICRSTKLELVQTQAKEMRDKQEVINGQRGY
jgi:Fe-S-cluster-containing hydrogenase component 2